MLLQFIIFPLFKFFAGIFVISTSKAFWKLRTWNIWLPKERNTVENLWSGNVNLRYIETVMFWAISILGDLRIGKILYSGRRNF